MQKEYIGSLETEFGLRHNLTKYTLSTGIEVILNDDEVEELYKGTDLYNEVDRLEKEVDKLEYQKEYYKEIIQDFTTILGKMKVV